MKKLIVLVGFLVVAAGVGGWVWYERIKEKQKIASEQLQQIPQEANSIQDQQNEVDSSEWKTYRNEEFGIEFQYPENMFLLKETYNDDGSLTILLREKGYSIRDLDDHGVNIDLHDLIPDKEYAHRTETDVAFISIPFSPGQGKWTMDTWKSDVSADYDHWVNFVEKGSCGSFSIYRDTEQYYWDHITIQCKEEEGLGSIYRDIYRSIRIFGAETSPATKAAGDVRM